MPATVYIRPGRKAERIGAGFVPCREAVAAAGAPANGRAHGVQADLHRRD